MIYIGTATLTADAAGRTTFQVSASLSWLPGGDVIGVLGGRIDWASLTSHHLMLQVGGRSGQEPVRVWVSIDRIGDDEVEVRGRVSDGPAPAPCRRPAKWHTGVLPMTFVGGA